MSWFNRPEGFTPKSFDAAAPTPAIRFTLMSPAITFTPYPVGITFRATMSPLERAEEDLDIHNSECFEPTCDEHMRLEEEVDLQSFEF